LITSLLIPRPANEPDLSFLALADAFIAKGTALPVAFNSLNLEVLERCSFTLNAFFKKSRLRR
jgi:hypothetical protein